MSTHNIPFSIQKENHPKLSLKVNVPHSLIAVGPLGLWGLKALCILGTADEGCAYSAHLVTLSFLESKIKLVV